MGGLKLARNRLFPLLAILLLVFGVLLAEKTKAQTPPTATYFIGCLDSGKKTFYNVSFGTVPPATPTCKADDTPVGWADGDVLGVIAGAGLAGGGSSGEIILSLLPSFRLPQGCSDGQTGKWNLAAGDWECANDDNNFYTAGQGLDLVGNQFDIADGGVTTAKLAGNSVTQYAVPVGTSPEFPLTGDGFQAVPGASVTINSTGGPVLLMVTGMVRVNTPGAIVVVSDIATDIEVGGGVAGTRYPFTLQTIYAPPAGTNTWQVYANIYGGGTAYVYVKSMIAIELKR